MTARTVMDAFAAAGWTVRTQRSGPDGESWATAGREDFGVRVYTGAGRGLTTLTGWTPVVYAERQLGQPLFTRSTADGPEDGHDSNTGAFLAVSRRPCRCGEFRCSWRNTLSRTDGHLLSHFHATCRTCATRRTHTFRPPLH
ncbi:hypothetical protein [Streptomyces sp. NBC_01422]|uniref:hypothetical protein n=1 Tax=Streptomyces sp. NBC_01422 TaxID=2903859 RepID=UPI002E2C69C7|nr:hypothetical protein [Streptomyces sp. NBC_01422]